MAARSEELRRKVSSSAYASLISGLSTIPRTPAAQRTASYGFSSIYDSPGSQLRPDSDIFVIEFGSRYLRAGYAGESAPRGVVAFGPDQSRRVGDYRPWLPDYGSSRKVKEITEDFGTEYQLWSMDVREVDFNLLENKLSRALWEVYTKYLLSDTFLPTRKFCLAIPPALPHPHLNTLLSTLFRMFQPASITLLSTPLLNTVAAGLRSGFVIDIGWSETIVTGVYEYCEVQQIRSVRATKMLLQLFAEMLNVERRRQVGTPIEKFGEGRTCDDITFEECEDIFTRLAWCYDQLQAVTAREQADLRDDHDSFERSSHMCSIPLSSCNPPMTLRLPFSRLAQPAEEALFRPKLTDQELDDHEQTLPLLAYRALLSLSSDMRAVCMSRIVFTGGGSSVPGLKRRVMEELENIIRIRGWDPVRNYGSGPKKHNPVKAHDSTSATVAISATQPVPTLSQIEGTRPTSQETLPASAAQQEYDPIAEKLCRDATKHAKPSVSGVLRAVDTLGAYAGLSLVAGLRIRGIAEIERDKFPQHGLTGASREKTVGARQSSTLGTQPGLGERTSWSLGVFA